MNQTKRIALLSAFALIAPYSWCTIARGATPTDQPATRKQVEDMQKNLRRGINQTDRDVQHAITGIQSIEQADEEIRQGQNAARSAERREHDGITTGIDNVRSTLTVTGAAQNQTLAAYGEKLSKGIWTVAWLCIGLFVVCGGGFALLHRNRPSPSRGIPAATNVVEIPILPDDPLPKQINVYGDYLERTSHVESFSVNVHPKNMPDVLEPGLVHKNSLGIRLIKFSGKATSVSLDKRRQAARESFLARRAK